MLDARAARAAFIPVTTLFFAWGFITSLVDPLVAAVKSIFSLSNMEAQLSAFAFFIAYGVMSVPAAILVAKMRPLRAILLALVLMIASCFVILAATNAVVYEGVLAGLFVMASGITVLQVAANPLAAALGPPARSHFRLTLSQAFNALGTVLGPLLGARLLLGGLEKLSSGTPNAGARTAALGAIDTAFLIIAAAILVLAIFLWSMRKRIEKALPTAGPKPGALDTIRQALTSRWSILGGVAIFLYVGAEVSIGTQMALLLNDDGIWGLSLQQAGYFVSLYWLGAMVGRFAGSALMIRLPASMLLMAATAIACMLCLYVLMVGGATAGYAALCVGLFNSIMFPTIFTLKLERSSASAEATSGLLVMMIVGGAIIPLGAGAVSDASGYVASFVIPAACYALLCGFAWFAGRTTPLPRSDGNDARAASLH